MENTRQPRVLDVGQCNMDHGHIDRLLAEKFGAQVDRSDTIAEAVKAVLANRYDLVLVNRILDTNGDEGIDLIRQLKAEESTRDTNAMLVSNYADAQEAAVAAGAKPGFGKASLNDDATLQALAQYLAAE